jgi:hypothetical protein
MVIYTCVFLCVLMSPYTDGSRHKSSMKKAMLHVGCRDQEQKGLALCSQVPYFLHRHLTYITLNIRFFKLFVTEIRDRYIIVKNT